MKHIIILIAIILTFREFTIAQSDSLQVPFDPIKMTKGLMVNINIGNIEIKGSDRDDILVKYAFTDERKKDDAPLTSDGLRRIAISKSNLKIQSLEDMIKISDSDFAHKLELYIEVPIQININTYKGGPGSLKIDNISGNLNLENNSGPIVATEINGIVNASTNEGGIKVAFASLPNDYAIILANVMGDIEVDLGKEEHVSFHMKTNSGELLTNLDLHMKESQSSRDNRPSNENGYSYSNNIWTDAVLNAGGPSMTISSIVGNIIIRGH